MQDLLAELLWKNVEIPEKAAHLCEELPGFETVQQEYHSTAEKIKNIVGYDLFDQFQKQLSQYTGYEVRAYYALGLGLREAFVRELGV